MLRFLFKLTKFFLIRIGILTIGLLFTICFAKLLQNHGSLIFREDEGSGFFRTGNVIGNYTLETVYEYYDGENSSEDMDTETYRHLPPCKIDVDEFKGRQNVSLSEKTLQTLESEFKASEHGGRYRPSNCRANGRTAIIVPYRDRDSHLKIFLNNIIPKLKRQKLDFTIIVIEQSSEGNFNRGMMRNIGFLEAKKMADFDCYVFNDVDTIFEDDRNLMRCGNFNVRHLVTGVDRDNYTLLYPTLIGGIIAFTKEQFVKVNGYSNFYFMWGAEDDDLQKRMSRRGIKIERPDVQVGYVSTLKHKRDPMVKKRLDILKSRDNANSAHDGLNSVKYEVLLMEKRKLYTWIYVSVNEREILKDLKIVVKKEKRRRRRKLRLS